MRGLNLTSNFFIHYGLIFHPNQPNIDRIKSWNLHLDIDEVKIMLYCVIFSYIIFLIQICYQKIQVFKIFLVKIELQNKFFNFDEKEKNFQKLHSATSKIFNSQWFSTPKIEIILILTPIIFSKMQQQVLKSAAS